jgi:hypothetical protein
LCAEHIRQLGGESPLSNLGEGLAKRKGVVARRGLKEAWSKKVRADEQKPDTRHTASGELATDNEAHIHQGRWL